MEEPHGNAVYEAGPQSLVSLRWELTSVNHDRLQAVDDESIRRMITNDDMCRISLSLLISIDHS